MSTPDQPESPQLTRKQLRELRNTGVTPVITDPAAAPSAGSGAPAPAAEEAAPASSAPAVQTIADVPPPATPLPRAAEPVVVPPAPGPDASVDLGAAPLTRRQARQQERIRTASVPVITPDVAAAHIAATTGATAPVAPEPAAESSPEPAAPTASGPIDTLPAFASMFAGTGQTPAAPSEGEPAEAQTSEPEADGALSTHTEQPEESDLRIFEDEGGPSADEPAERAVVNPDLGAGLLAGVAAQPNLPPSFDQLLARDTATTGSVASPSTLIVSQASTDAPLVAPVASTGEVLVTGTFALPEGLGSTGHAPGTTDGKDIDAVLVDGELPTHSSPTPIAASAAVSTVKTTEDLIRPPAPERGSKLMLSLAITAGVLALALVGVLVFALATGVLFK